LASKKGDIDAIKATLIARLLENQTITQKHTRTDQPTYASEDIVFKPGFEIVKS
jgi:hypothetical protein